LAARVRAALGPELAATVRRVAVTGPGELPVTVTGKVRKVALRERHLAEAAP
jgi:acyl-coenzyme A synthetase/AMP-(fatty) acid ligase